MVEVTRSLQGTGVPCVRSHLLLDVVCDDGRLFMALPNGPLIAQLNEQLNESLKPLVEVRTVRLVVLANKRNILE